MPIVKIALKLIKGSKNTVNHTQNRFHLSHLHPHRSVWFLKLLILTLSCMFPVLQDSNPVQTLLGMFHQSLT
uniref:Uncharacterized protein n=1 Tax=uncultured marine virus TaxID=186617 RepID=A0A0F7L9I4_9VIRU|nr:hypothetical protein [uncultured marine virus]